MIWPTTFQTWVFALALAMPLVLLIDQWWGEPPIAFHPVVWMGRLLGVLGRHVPPMPAGRAMLAGALAWCLGALLTLTLACLLQAGIMTLADQAAVEVSDTFMSAQPGVSASTSSADQVGRVESAPATHWPTAVSTILASVLLALAMKPLLSLRLLIEEALAVEAALGQSLAAGRERTARICSRDTRALDATELRETAIESVSENLVDSVVAPLFWFAVAGLPGAALYRWANTADAMWGYRDMDHEWSGKFAARVDDVMSWVPARLTALALWPTSHGRQLLNEAGQTPSPNGGWPMAATALSLGIRLAKPGVYVLNAGGRAATASDLTRAVSLIGRAAWRMALALGMLLAGIALGSCWQHIS